MQYRATSHRTVNSLLWGATATHVLILAIVISGQSGCANKSNVDEAVSRVSSDVSRLEGKLDALAKSLGEATAATQKLEELKVKRQERVDILNRVAEGLAAAMAWESDADAYEDHCNANRQRHEAITEKPRSPDDAKTIEPFAGFEPHRPIYQESYVDSLPEAKKAVFSALDRNWEGFVYEARRGKIKEAIALIVGRIETMARDAREQFQRVRRLNPSEPHAILDRSNGFDRLKELEKIGDSWTDEKGVDRNFFGEFFEDNPTVGLLLALEELPYRVRVE